jgi:uncharacterized membrane protein HdeD (DUF308 family)
VLKTNVGTTDRVLQVILGLMLPLAFFLYAEAGWRWFALIGVIPLVTGLVGSCPVYSLLGVSTCPMKKS